MPPPPTIDLTSPAFARRLANLLVERRRHSGKSLRALARASGGEFSVRELQAIEEGRAPLDEERIGAVALVYQADLGTILPLRLPLEIRECGVLSTSGLAAPFIPEDETSVLASYLRLVRQLRSQEREPVIELRRDDVEVLATYLGDSGERIIDRLGALMGATMTQRRAMAGMFLAGALVIGLTSGSVAALGVVGGGGGGSTATDPTSPTTVVTTTNAPVTTLGAPVTTTAGSAPSTVPVPVTTEPATTAPATTAPATTAPATTAPAATLPATTAPATTVAPNVPVTTAVHHAPSTTTTTPAPTPTTAPDSGATTTLPDPFSQPVPTAAVPVDASSTTVVDIDTPPAPTTTAPQQATDLPPVPTTAAPGSTVASQP